MRKILGLDLGTNSIGWALVNEDSVKDTSFITGIDGAGSRIIPMSSDIMGNYEKGNSVSQTEERTRYRGIRRLRERFLLRRERLHRVLRIMGFLPEHYSASIDRMGKFLKGTETKIEWAKNKDGKYEFLFQDTFHEMLEAFKVSHPEFSDGRTIPADWTLYYLRKKALNRRVSKEELAWILLNFNQKRGYYQLRGEEDDADSTVRKEYMKLIVVNVEDTGERKGMNTWYNVHLNNGLIYKRSSDRPLDWIGKEKEFIVTSQLAPDGSIKTDKDGAPRISLKIPDENDWTLLKKRTEADICDSGKTVGEFIFDEILSNPDVKIIGRLVRTIERKFYKEELRRIIRKQCEFHSELNDHAIYLSCIKELYPNNEAYRSSISDKDFVYLLTDDIIFYQRPLKRKKHLISNCPYENRRFKNPETGEMQTIPVKCIARSHPLFQEFRIWQFISNLRIYDNNRNIDATHEYLPDERKADLFEWLNDRKEIDQDTLLTRFFGLKKINDRFPVRWNYVEDKKYPCNKTRHAILSKLKKNEINNLTQDLLIRIWHLLYSVTTKEEIDSVFCDGKKKRAGIYEYLLEQFSDETVQKFKSVQFEEDDYGSYSEKALKKLLPLMRTGRLWTFDNIDSKTRDRIEKILSGEFDADITDKIREKCFEFSDITDFQGLPVWTACYVAYGRYSEAKETCKWSSPDDIDAFLNNFRQHSLNNPIVEQIVMETLRTVKDIWTHFGRIDEIHIELGRELKSTKEQRERNARRITENENTNQRIRTLLKEFMNPEFDIEGVRPYSSSQQDILKIYEDAVLQNETDRNDDINNIISKLNSSEPSKRPSRSEVLRYKLWLDQKYRSPYTGQPIPLAKLFTHEYEIEHVIPQSRYFDDSFQNKVICEAEVNKLKDRQLGLEFIKNHHGQIVTLSGGRTVSIVSVESYEKFVRDTYSGNRTKMKNLLLEDIPDSFIERQLNDSRYISRYIMSLLSNIVRKEVAPGVYEEETNSRNLIACNGSITTRLKQDWGLNDIWNSIILPRFVRLNEICGKDQFTSVNSEGHLIPAMPDELKKGFTKKRVDHRHHAMDAIVIACATRNHIHLLNNEAAKSENLKIRHQLSHKLRRYDKILINGKEREVAREFLKPWPTFTQDVRAVLENIIVSFKQNLRVINKATNKYTSYSDETGRLRLDKAGKPLKGVIVQESNPDWWAVRKPLHKDTVFAKVSLRKIKEVRLGVALQNVNQIVDKDLRKEIKRLLGLKYDEKRIKKFFNEGDNKDIWAEFNPNKIKIYYYTDDTFAVRKSLDESFTSKKIEESVTDTGIQKILLKHLEESGNDPKIAFCTDGIERMNADIKRLNNGKEHKPIYKVRWYESANKFAVGKSGNKKDKYVEAAKGTNLYFAVYATADGTRSFETIPLNEVVERLKNKLSPVPEKNEKGDSLLFYLSPNDLVYLPTEGDITNGININSLDCSRIYKFADSSGTTANFIPHRTASIIFSLPKDLAARFCMNNEIIQNEFGMGSPQSKNQKAITGEMIKEICTPLKIDRLGNITYIGTEFLPKKTQ